ncbi:hypothetical protein [Bradyrhizobium sp. USDA 3650]
MAFAIGAHQGVDFAAGLYLDPNEGTVTLIEAVAQISPSRLDCKGRISNPLTFDSFGGKMAKYSASFFDGGALQFDENSIRDLVSAGRNYLETAPTITLEFDGDHNLQSDDLENILSDPYIRSRNIISVQINGSRYRPEPARSFQVKISSEYATLGSVRLSIEGDRDASIVTRNQVETTIRGCWTWYARLYRPIDVSFQLIRLISGWTLVYALLFSAFLKLRGFPETPEQLAKLAAETLFLSPTIYLIVAFLRNRLFPKLLFAIGKSADAVARAAYWRNFVFIGVGLALLTGIAATLITDRFK